MKKLLSLLGAITLTASASASVIACTTKEDDAKNDESGVINSDKIKLDANKILDIILKNGDEDFITNGDADKTLQNFINIFTFAMAANPGLLKDANKTANSIYENDNFVDDIKTAYSDFINDMNEEWNQAEKDAREKYGKDFDKKYKEDLEKRYAPKKYDSWEGYKEDFIFKNGITNQTLLNKMAKEITDDAKGTGTISTSNVINSLRSFFSSDQSPVAGKPEFNFNFAQNSFKLQSPQDPRRQKSWFGQFDNYLSGLKYLADNAKDEDGQKTFEGVAYSLVMALNATGGIDLEDLLDKDKTSISVDEVTWATYDNIKTKVLNGDIKEWSNKLVKRLDNNYIEHFNDKVASSGEIAIDGGIQELSALGRIDQLGGISYRNIFPEILNLTSKDANIQVNGLFSNSERFFANSYFNQKKPVAVTEILVKPWNDKPKIDWEKEVNNDSYLEDGNLKYKGLYNFIGTFVNSDIYKDKQSVEGVADYTKKMFEDESKYSWDILLENGAKLEDIKHNGNENTGNAWTPQNGMWYNLKDNVSLVDHNNLLTVDSKTTNSTKEGTTGYTDTLKYAVYNFLTDQSKPEYGNWNADSRPSYINDYDYNAKINDDNDKEIAKSISGLIHSLDRSGGTTADKKNGENANVYQVLNKDQGIIAYTDAAGIHFVRIEGFKLIDSNNKTDGVELLRDQKKLSTKDQGSEDSNTTKAFATHNQLAWNMNNANTPIGGQILADSAKTESYDYLNRDTYSQGLAKFSYKNLNNSFGNAYEEFLANASILNGFNQGKYKFDFKNEVKNWLSATPSDGNYWISVWDYIKEIFGIKPDGNRSSDEVLFDDFFTLIDVNDNGRDAKDKEIIKNFKEKYKEIILRTLRSTRNRINANADVELVKQWNQYEENHKFQINKDENIKYVPWNYIENGKENLKKLKATDTWKIEKTQAAQPSQIFYNLDFDKYLILKKELEGGN